MVLGGMLDTVIPFWEEELIDLDDFIVSMALKCQIAPMCTRFNSAWEFGDGLQGELNSRGLKLAWWLRKLTRNY